MNLYRKILVLYISPTVGWHNLSKLTIMPKIMHKSVFIPTLLFLAFSSLPQLLYNEEMSIITGILNSFIAVASYFITFYICSILLNFFYPGDSQDAKDRLDNLLLICLSYLAILDTVNNLLPSDFPMIMFMSIYVAVLIYKGLDYVNFSSDKFQLFVTSTSLSLIALPVLITAILSLFIPTSI